MIEMKNHLDSFSSIFKQTEERIGNFEDKTIEIKQSEKQKNKK